MQEHALVSRHMTAGLDNVSARKYFYIALDFSKTNNRTVPMPSA